MDLKNKIEAKDISISNLLKGQLIIFSVNIDGKKSILSF